MTAFPPVSLHLCAASHLTRALLRGRRSSARRLEASQHAAYYRRLWSEAAAHVDAPAVVCESGALAVDLGPARITVEGTYCSIDGPDVLDRAGDKLLVHRLLAEQGIPAPRFRAFTLAEIDSARRFLLESPGPCVVKPAKDGAAGRGVTTGVRRRRDLWEAAIEAASAGVQTGSRPGGRIARYRRLATVPLLIERQVTGENYRLLYLDGVLVDAIRRGAPSVVGDGITTVRGLLDRLNGQRMAARRHGAQSLVTDDLDCVRTLAQQGLEWSSVPIAGRAVRLKTTINQAGARDNVPARDEFCSAVVGQGARAAAAVGARWAGIDVITQDPSVPLEASGGCILEVNTTPGLAMHHHGRPGEVEPAKVLLARLKHRAESARAVTARAEKVG